MIPMPNYHNLTISMTPKLSAPSCRARLGVMVVAVLLVLFPEPPLGFFFRASRTCAASRGRTSRGCTTAAELGCATGAGEARARVANRRVDRAANFILEDEW
jgi:hypothetical protein